MLWQGISIEPIDKLQHETPDAVAKAPTASDFLLFGQVEHFLPPASPRPSPVWVADRALLARSQAREWF